MNELCNYNIIINDIRFVWSPRKASQNAAKHFVTFLEAATVFTDAHYIEISDPEHSDDEERFIALGFSSAGNMLIVCHCIVDSDDTVRIISARKATARESKQYGEHTNERRI
jgi:uncharacterized DUF497 family protein